MIILKALGKRERKQDDIYCTQKDIQVPSSAQMIDEIGGGRYCAACYGGHHHVISFLFRHRGHHGARYRPTKKWIFLKK